MGAVGQENDGQKTPLAERIRVHSVMIGRSLSCLPENRFLFYESFFPEEINSFEGIDGIIYNTKMKPPKVVLDTNVLVSALRSKQGASHRLL